MENKEKIIITILFIIALSARLYIAFSTPLIIGDDTAFHLRISEEIAKNSYFFYDSLMERINIYPPFIHYLTAFLIAIGISGQIAVKLLPSLLSSLSILILFLLLKKFCKIEIAFLLSLIASLSTVVIYRSLFSPPESLATGFLILTLFYEKKYSIVLLFSQAYSFLLSIFSILIKEIKNSSTNKKIFISISIAAVFFIMIKDSYLFYFKDSFFDLSSEVYLSSLISHPLELILISLAFIACLKEKDKRLELIKYAYITLFLMFIFLHQERLRNLSMLLFLSPIFLRHYLKWEKIPIIILITSIFVLSFGLFSFNTYNNEIGDITQSLNWIKNNTEKNAIFLSFGTHWITSADRKSIVDPLTVNEIFQNEKWKDVFYLTFNLTDEEKNIYLLEKYNISYIFAYNKTWNIYSYSEKNFEKLFENNSTSIYRIQTR